MYNKLPLILLLTLVTVSAYAQRNLVLVKSTLTSVGSSTVLLPTKKQQVQQSIGQSGLVGLSKFRKTSVQQGFLSNTKFYTIDNSSTITFEEKLDVVVAPNPFIDYIKVNFTNKTQAPITLNVYDVNGKIYLQKSYDASDSITLSMKGFSIGNYIIYISSGKDKFVKKIFKNQ